MSRGYVQVLVSMRARRTSKHVTIELRRSLGNSKVKIIWHLVLPEQSLGQYSSPSFVQRLGDYIIEVRFVILNLICSKPQHASVDLYASRHYSKLVAEHIPLP